ncbi:MAG: trypsin-like peptidase domain-containing protein, partial [Thermoplasmata archaeon]
MGALLLRFQIINDKRVFSFILSDRGNGFADISDNGKRVGNVLIHEAVKEGRSLGWPGAAGYALTQTVALADHISITTVDRIGSESHASCWEKGFSLEQPLESALVEEGTKIMFVKEITLSETTITSNRNKENKTENKKKRQEFTRRQILQLVIAALIPGKNIAQAKTTLATTKRLEKREHRAEDSRPLKSSPSIPMGFFDPQSKDLPAHFRIAAQKVYPTIARILTYEKKDGKERPAALGSGVVVSPDGHVMTKYHVISDRYRIDVEIPTIQNSVIRFKRYSKVKVIEDICDNKLGVGVVKVEVKTPLPYIKPESVDPKPGDEIIMVGHPEGTQRCYVSVGKILEPSANDEPFQFKHNAYSKRGSSGNGVFLMDSGGNVHFMGIVTYAYMPYAENDDPEFLKYYVRALSQLDKLKATRPNEDIPLEVVLQDIINTSNPNIGVPLRYITATRLSVYLSTDKASKLLSYADLRLKPFEGPTFVLTRSLSFTYGK